MKSYTDIEQSKSLAEILPLKSADMEYMFLKKDGSKVSNVPFVKDGFEEPECCYIFIPCWSLAALINAMPKIQSDKAIIYLSDNDNYVSYTHLGINAQASNLVDACYEIILKLHEQKLL